MLAVVALLCALGALVAGAAAAAGVPSITNSGNDLRDGWYPTQPKLSPDLVGGGTFGQLWSTPVDGQVYMQPLVSAGRVVVATERNQVYSLNAETGKPAWTKRLGPSYKASDIGCGDLWPDLGVTATPVIDPVTNTIYLTHKTYVSGTSGAAAWYVDALDADTGEQRTGFPVRLTGTAQNAPGVSFDAKFELQRPGLLLLDGVVYAAFGGHCDIPPYQGWVFGVSTAGDIRARWTAVTSGSGAGIWQSGSGLMSDGPGRIFLSTGNTGSPTPPLPTPNGMFGESVVRLGVQGDGTLKAMDFFAPYDAAHLDSYDADFASGGVTALRDDTFGTTEFPHVAVAVGKAGYVYLLDRDGLGGIGMGENGGDRVISRVGPYGGVWSRPGVWPGDGGWIAIPTASPTAGDQASGSSGHLKLYRYRKGAGRPSLDEPIQSDDAFGFSSSAPVITSDGTTSGSAVLWIIWSANGWGGDAQLRAYDAVPVNGHLRLRKSWPIGQSAKFAMPGVGDGRIYVGTRDGKVLGFGAPVAADVQAPSTTFPLTTIGETSTQNVKVTIGAAVTIKSIAASPSGVFTAQTAGLDLSQRPTVTVPVDFAPTAAGSVGGSLSVTTDKTTFSFSLNGTGQSRAAQLVATPPTLSFGGATVGESRAGTISFGNAGGQPLEVTAVTPPGAPFTLQNAPPVGSKIAPGDAVNVTVRYRPTAAGQANDELTLETSAGTKTIGLSGTAGFGGHLTITPSQGWAFGAVPTGTSKTVAVTLANTGDSALPITKSKPPTDPAFEVLDELPEGTTIAAGDSLRLRVRFRPAAAGAVNGAWTINAGGLQQVPLTGEGIEPVAPDPSPAPAPAAPGPPGDPLTPAPVGPDLSAQGLVASAKVRPDLTVAAARVSRDARRVTLSGRASDQAAGALSVMLSARVARRTVTVTTGGRLRGGRFTVRLDLPGVARQWRSLRILVRFAGSDRVWPGVGSLVVVRGR